MTMHSPETRDHTLSPPQKKKVMITEKAFLQPKHDRRYLILLSLFIPDTRVYHNQKTWPSPLNCRPSALPKCFGLPPALHTSYPCHTCKSTQRSAWEAPRRKADVNAPCGGGHLSFHSFT